MRFTEQELRQAIATAEAALAGANQAYPPELFPELNRRRGGDRGHAFAATAEPPAQVQQSRPAPAPVPAADGEITLTPETVARWSHELGFDRPYTRGRVTKADD